MILSKLPNMGLKVWFSSPLAIPHNYIHDKEGIGGPGTTFINQRKKLHLLPQIPCRPLQPHP